MINWEIVSHPSWLAGNGNGSFFSTEGIILAGKSINYFRFKEGGVRNVTYFLNWGSGYDQIPLLVEGGFCTWKGEPGVQAKYMKLGHILGDSPRISR